MITTALKGQHYKALFTLGTPLAGSQLAHMAIGVTDSVMLGWYSVQALAAGVLGQMVFFVIFIVGSGIGNAVMPMVARAHALNNGIYELQVTRMGVWLSAAFSVLVFPFFFFSKELLILIQQPAILAADASLYLRIVGFAVFPALVLHVMKSFLSALQLTSFVLLATVFSFFLNILLNYILIFGKLGFDEFGLQGSALASLIVNIFTAVLVCLYAASKTRKKQLFRKIWCPDKIAMLGIIKLGLPISVTSLAESGLFAASTMMMGWLGTVAVAAHGIALHITSLTFVIHMGLSSAATILVGQAYAAGKFAQLKRNVIAAAFSSSAVVLLTVVLFLTAPKFLISLFVDPNAPEIDEILIYGCILLYMAALFSAVDAAQVMALGVLRGLQDTSVPMGMSVFSYWIVGISAAYFLCFQLEWGGVGLWAGLALGLACAAAGLIWRFIVLYRRMIEERLGNV